ncbi:hypothetical protein [Halalkalibacter urbisdiaboli]|uniref:hypothetical protein n=1 Tax=Halalkalibacter urbisdiaboli TaxID=1960589 RepID=UPI000B43DF2A|nr:hypothetical protein [Halalkalibacter urbisdiaboli]
MQLKKIQHFAMLIMICLTATACSVSQEETLDTVKQYFADYQVLSTSVNTEITDASFYLPSGFNIVEEVDYNVVLEKSGQTFVLFHNPLEGKMSDINLKRDREDKTNSLLFEEKQSSEAHSYLVVVPNKEEHLLVIVGVGGAKLSTITSYENLQNDVETMLEIVHSYDVE